MTARVAGLALGLGGLVVIFGAGLDLGAHAAAGLARLCVAGLLHSLSLVLVKRYGAELPSFTVTSGALLVVTPLFLVTWLALDGHAPPQLRPRALASIVYLGIIGSVIGFTLFFYVVKKVPAHTSALITLITPIIALLLGTAINHEHVGPRIWAGTVLVLGGLALHQWGGLLGRLIPVRVSDTTELPPGP